LPSGTVQPPTIWAGWEEELSAASEESEESADAEDSAADDEAAALDDAESDADADELLELLAHPIRAKQAARAPIAIHTINRFIESPFSVDASHLPLLDDVQVFYSSCSR
jgi:hypothetical protein